eukprot:TRINITY_DN25316_c0_g1_i1.p1 TRINITY_DN25316_c0_g1~~TRINITY_DN25316_c0_g1_i1.p1  ORF type:complete len:810 (+),score=209.27 TRINITY_DN25316_c0_g1_i1:106-2535(+)
MGKFEAAIDLDLELDFPSPPYEAHAPAVKAEPVRPEDVPHGAVSLTLPPAAPVALPPPARVARADPSNGTPPPPPPPPARPSPPRRRGAPSLPPHPRLVFSYFRPTETAEGPAQLVMLPPLARCGASTAGRGAEEKDHKTQWTANLLATPRTALAQNRRSYARPAVSDLLARLRSRAEGKAAQVHVAVVPQGLSRFMAVPASLSVAYLNTHRLLLALVDAAFSLREALVDFLYLSLLRREVMAGVYTTPPQLVLQLHRRYIASQCLRGADLSSAEALVERLDTLWRRWRGMWFFTRHSEVGGCHDHIEAMLDRNETAGLKKHMAQDQSGRRLLKDRFVYGAGKLLRPEDWDTSPPEMMTVLEAGMRVLLAPEAYPAFTVHAPFDLLDENKKYRVSFRQLRGGVRIDPSATSTLFVRNWAVPFLDMPGDGRFRVPNLSDAPRAPVPLAVQPDLSRMKPAAPSATPPTGAQWAAPMVTMVGTRRYYSKMRAGGVVYSVGDDVCADAGALPKSLKELAKKTLGRIVEMSDEGDAQPKRVALRQWAKKAANHEVFGTEKVVEVPAERVLMRVEVRVVAPVACALPPLPPAAGVAGDVYHVDVAALRDTLTPVSAAGVGEYTKGTKWRVKGAPPVVRLAVSTILAVGATGSETATPLYTPPKKPIEFKMFFGKPKSATQTPPPRDSPPPEAAKPVNETPPEIAKPVRETPPVAVKPAAGTKRTADEVEDDVQIVDPPPASKKRPRVTLRRTPTPTPSVKLEPVKAEAPPVTSGRPAASAAAPAGGGAPAGLPDLAALLQKAAPPVAVHKAPPPG